MLVKALYYIGAVFTTACCINALNHDEYMYAIIYGAVAYGYTHCMVNHNGHKETTTTETEEHNPKDQSTPK